MNYYHYQVFTIINLSSNNDQIMIIIKSFLSLIHTLHMIVTIIDLFSNDDLIMNVIFSTIINFSLLNT